MKLAFTRAMAGAVAGLTALSMIGGAIAPARAADDPHLFKETDHSVGGAFLQYWNTHGGLAQQGRVTFQ